MRIWATGLPQHIKRQPEFASASDIKRIFSSDYSLRYSKLDSCLMVKFHGSFGAKGFGWTDLAVDLE